MPELEPERAVVFMVEVSSQAPCTKPCRRTMGGSGFKAARSSSACARSSKQRRRRLPLPALGIEPWRCVGAHATACPRFRRGTPPGPRAINIQAPQAGWAGRRRGRKHQPHWKGNRLLPTDIGCRVSSRAIEGGAVARWRRIRINDGLAEFTAGSALQRGPAPALPAAVTASNRLNRSVSLPATGARDGGDGRTHDKLRIGFSLGAGNTRLVGVGQLRFHQCCESFSRRG